MTQESHDCLLRRGFPHQDTLFPSKVAANLSRSFVKMQETHRFLLQKHRLTLCRDLEPTIAASHLFCRFVFSETDKETVSNNHICSFERNGILLDKLTKKGPEAFDKFCDILKEIKPHLEEMLKSDDGTCYTPHDTLCCESRYEYRYRLGRGSQKLK